MAAVVSEIDQIRQMLTWIGFDNQGNQTSIIDDAFSTFADIQNLTEKDVTELSESFARRTSQNDRINFGIRRTKRIKHMMHWVQDFYRVSSTPSTAGLNEDTFLAALTVAGERADVRKLLREQSDEKAKVASPGPLVSENKWIEWEPKFVNYLSTLIGMNGVPLSYVVRENDNPDQTGPHANFTEECIACAPLSGVGYDSDRSAVHQALVSFTTGQPSENWIKATDRYKDGRRSMKKLRDHFSGEGNTTRRIAEADRIKETLHYKNERSLPFEAFLTKCEKMYNIYAQHGEVMAEDAKIRFLFKKVQHSGLSSAIEAMKAKITTEAPGTVTYSTVANHLSTAVSELPDYVARNRNVSGMTTGSTSIYNADGTINTGHHPNWLKLSSDDQKKVNDERSRLGLGKNKNRKRSNKRSSSNAENTIKQLKAANALHKRTIASLKMETTDNSESSPSGDTPDIEGDPSDAFGGKSKKKKT